MKSDTGFSNPTGMLSGPVEQSFLVLSMTDSTSSQVAGRSLKACISSFGKLFIIDVSSSIDFLRFGVSRSDVVLKCWFSFSGSTVIGVLF